jgi:NADPH-dependent 2,4-dienoyl-CoA reductase/sulfur reductase-like enzyme
MAERNTYLIIGNGIAGATAAEMLRSENAAADIMIVADYPCPVYYRPALKDYLGGKFGEEKLWARPAGYYQERRIHFLSDAVVGIHVRSHVVLLRSGRALAYTRLLLAQGARARTLNCPGAHLVGVTTLRTVADYQKVLGYLSNVRRVVVVGSGTLALETIETLRHRGYQVTHLLRHRRLWSEVLDMTASDLVLQQALRDEVDVRYEQEIAEICGRDGHVAGIITKDGTQISCELVLLCIGIEPCIEVARQAGIFCGAGVRVDDAMRTSAPDVYAAGDLIEAVDPLTGRVQHTGHWYPAIQQARAAAYSMLDLLDTYQHYFSGNFYNATCLYGLDFASVGHAILPREQMASDQFQEIIAEPQPRIYQKVLLKHGVPIGALALGNRERIMAFKRAIDHQVDLTPVAARLFAHDFQLDVWLNQQGVPLPELGVNRVGANAVKQAAYASTNLPASLLHLDTITEGILIPIAPPEIISSLEKIYLSQTKVTVIGRQEGCDLYLQHASISRRHAEISFVNGHYVLRDLASKNGTFLNDQRVEPESIHLLSGNETLRFGQIQFVFCLRQASPEASLLLHAQKSSQHSEDIWAPAMQSRTRQGV